MLFLKSTSNRILLVMMLCIIFCLSSFFVYNSNYMGMLLDDYARSITQKTFGSMPLAKHNEFFIRTIAQEMDAPDNIVIRRMNSSALKTFGYHNAFAYFVQLWGFLPISSVPFLFVSEGFFEDLTPEEQRFLIGHEMVHIKEQHTLFMMPSAILLLCFLVIALLIVRKKIKSWVYASVSNSYQRGLYIIVISLLMLVSIIISDTGFSMYQRYIEKVADRESLQKLSSYEGCLKLLDRWQSDFQVSAQNPYYGLFSDHPSCTERKEYCLVLQNHYNQREVTS